MQSKALRKNNLMKERQRKTPRKTLLTILMQQSQRKQPQKRNPPRRACLAKAMQRPVMVANVSRKQLDAFGGTLTQYMNQWNKSGKRPTKVSKAKTGSDDSKPKKKVSPVCLLIRRALLGKDEKFGGDSAIDFIRRKKKPKNKAGGGSEVQDVIKGGKMGGKMAPGYNKGGSAKKPVPSQNKGLSKLPKDVRNKMGYMNEGGEAKVKNPTK